jgi:hypothetical protein
MNSDVLGLIQSGNGFLPWLAVFVIAGGGAVCVVALYLMLRRIGLGARQFRMPSLRRRKATRPVGTSSPIKPAAPKATAANAYRQTVKDTEPKSHPTKPTPASDQQKWQAKALSLYMERITDLQNRLNTAASELESCLVKKTARSDSHAEPERKQMENAVDAIEFLSHQT